MARRRRNDAPQQGYDDMGYAEPQRGDYYPESDGGMVDPRPQRRRDDRGDGGRGRRPAPDGSGYAGGYDAAPQQEQGGGAGKVVKVILVILLTIFMFIAGAALSLVLAGRGIIPSGITEKLGISAGVDETELLSYYGEDIEQAVKDGTVAELLAADAEDDYEAADSTLTTDPYGTTATTDPYGTTATTDPYGTTATTDPNAMAVDPNAQQPAAVDPNTQQPVAVDPNTQQPVAVDPNTQQQVAVDPNAQQQVVDPNAQQQVIDPNAQQQG